MIPLKDKNICTAKKILLPSSLKPFLPCTFPDVSCFTLFHFNLRYAPVNLGKDKENSPVKPAGVQKSAPFYSCSEQWRLSSWIGNRLKGDGIKPNLEDLACSSQDILQQWLRKDKHSTELLSRLFCVDQEKLLFEQCKSEKTPTKSLWTLFLPNTVHGIKVSIRFGLCPFCSQFFKKTGSLL